MEGGVQIQPVINALKHEITRLESHPLNFTTRDHEEDRIWMVEVLKRYVSLFERFTIIGPAMFGMTESDYACMLEQYDSALLLKKDELERMNKAFKIMDLL